MGMGDVFALIGAALAIALPAVGSAVGMGGVQQAAAGVISEDPKKFGKTLILQLIPSSATLYGFVVAFLVLLNTQVMGGDGYANNEGLIILAACLPIAIVGCIATMYQGKVCAAGVRMLAKDESLSGRALTMGVFIELFILFALIVSILSVFGVDPSGPEIANGYDYASTAITNIMHK